MVNIYSNFLSPIDDYSDLPFRLLCQKYGAVATCVPLVNSTAIFRDQKNLRMVDAHEDERNIGVQLVGNIPQEIGLATRVIIERFPFVKWINLNCGCPSVRTMHCGGGSAMLAHPQKILDAIAQMQSNSQGTPISVKMRLKDNIQTTISIAKSIEAAGADFLILHGRTAGAGYSGKCDWEAIKQVKENISIPLVGNGDLQSEAEGRVKVDRGYCDSFMIARSAMSNPKVFCNESVGLSERWRLLDEYNAMHQKYLGETPAKKLKLKAIQFMNTIPNAALLRNKIASAKTVEQIFEIRKED
ncbi:tRNA-dihydrouridine synthase family protein [Candidatus Micrarchaeota archaeon]|nr:tRNA-dihydrouridine synthase family protein [Candidatus Micrarchaeota archaeon]